MKKLAIELITEDEFSEYVTKTLTGLTKEFAWYQSNTSDLIGTLFQDSIDKDWGYVILAKEEDGNYRPQDVGGNIASQSVANKELYGKMLQIEEAGQIVDDLYEDENEILDLPKIEIMTIDDHIKAYFKNNPEKLYEMSPRKFEELVASIIKDMGFDVELTQATRDGGRDIIAYIKTGICSYLTHIECKRYAPDNKVSVDIIRSVAGVHHMRNANKSIIVTTGFFTKDARSEAKLIENSLDLKDYNDLKDMLSRY